jgi:phosphate:Na+ symporter
MIRWAGPSLDSKMASLMGTRLGSILTGLIFGTLAPSSTTQSVLAAQLVGNQRIAPENILSFLLWANLGITLTVQLISLKVGALYPIPLIAGVTLFMLCRRRIPRSAGQCLFAFGLIFLAMNLIGDAASKMAADGDSATIMEILARHKIAMFIFAALAAVVTQSSLAVMGAFFAASYSGVVDLGGLLPVVLGATVGVGITTVAACWGMGGSARPLAISALALKISVCLPALLLLTQVTHVMSQVPVAQATQASLFHAMLNLTIALLATAIGPLLRSAFQSKVSPASLSLDYSLLASPELALACASRETLKMGETVRRLYELSWGSLGEREGASGLHEVEEAEDSVSAYVSRMDWRTMTPRQRELAFGILNFVSHLAVVADMIWTQLRVQVEKLSDGEKNPENQNWGDLLKIREMVARRLDMSTAVLASRDPLVAKAFLDLGLEVKKGTILTLKRQYASLSQSPPPDPNYSIASVVSVLRRVSGQLNTIGHTFSPGILESAEESSDQM